MIIILLLFLPIALCATPQVMRYDSYQVIRIVPQTEEQLQSLFELSNRNINYKLWSNADRVNQSVDIMIPPNSQDEFNGKLSALHMDGKLLIDDVQSLINRESSSMPNDSNDFGWKHYHTLDEIYNWLFSLAKKYSDMVTVIKGGHTYEKRDIIGVKISYNNGSKAIFIEGGIHAREWIGPATATYLINEILTSSDPSVRRVAESRDWYIFPVTNPDGFQYTRTNRLWRKNRKRYGLCYGVDLNRNWGYKWMHGGSSRNPCQDTYAGPKAFSEIEAKSLSEFINTISHTIDGYIALHSYSQLLLIPFGDSSREVPKNNEQLKRIGNIAIEVLAQRYGTKYSVKNIPELYVASGGSTDWVLGTHNNIKYAYTYELRDTGRYGFLLPQEEIIPTAEETVDSIFSIVSQFEDEEHE